MKKTWKAYFVLFGDEVTYNLESEFEVSEEEYKELTNAVNNNIPLTDLDLYDDLIDRAENHIDFSECNEYQWLLEEEPKEEDFDDPEEYKDALAEFNEEKETFLDRFNIDDYGLIDPGEHTRFKNEIIGLEFPEWKGQEEETVEVDDFAVYGVFKKDTDYWSGRTASFTLYLDKDGKVSDVSEVEEKTMESESIKSSNWSNCEPSYDYIIRYLEKLSEKQKNEATE